ncbi:hypothetical protein [Arthrobacter mobilis]|uniref:Uncharacterized protein n=1 Tax=Arthrobacter mobilis TaxID=2724944 RepID=A0A7X6K7K2_9MICC|nr:hypothetical protein [Arthrobacter mobilis]
MSGFLPELIALFMGAEINPGEVFGLTLPPGQAAEPYQAMDERRQGPAHPLPQASVTVTL